MARNGDSHSHSHSHSHADGHSHSHGDAHSHSHAHAHGGHHHPHPHGHNAPGARQWQTPHLTPDHHHPPEAASAEPDLDLVERAFVDAFPKAPDPTSFLRLAGIPFTGKNAAGKTLNLLRVETEFATDIGSLTPHVGGGTFRYDPLPAKLTSQRSTLAFVYFDGAGVVRLTLAEAKALEPVTG